MVGRGRGGFTIVELLVVISIICILLALLLPAVHAAREAARATMCRNNLKPLGLGATVHQSVHRHFPSGGWGWDWVGDPDRGFGPGQPGFWAFNRLPFIDAKEVWRLGKGIDFDKDPVSKQRALVPQVATPISIFYCPSRRSVSTRPYTAPEGGPLNCDLPKGELVAKSNYAANCGDQDAVESTGGPKTLAAADNGSYIWPITLRFTGVSFQRSQITPALITDGMGKTILFAEKYLDGSRYENGMDRGNNECVTSGMDNDTYRTGSPKYRPMSDRRALPGAADDDWFRFGSAHTQKFSAVYCDGSVHGIGYEIDPNVFANLCNRSDGRSVNSDKVE